MTKNYGQAFLVVITVLFCTFLLFLPLNIPKDKIFIALSLLTAFTLVVITFECLIDAGLFPFYLA